jgi:hypothetical protein
MLYHTNKNSISILCWLLGSQYKTNKSFEAPKAPKTTLQFSKNHQRWVLAIEENKQVVCGTKGAKNDIAIF